MNELITVIIPVYNVERYLDECISSVVNQTYKKLEIILVDDGSTDRSGEICDRWQDRDSRIKVIHQKNEGVSAARNSALGIFSGNYLGFVDSDDWCEETMFEELLKSIIENNSSISMCGFYDYPNGMEHPIIRGKTHHSKCSNVEAVIPLYESGGYFVSIWNKLFCRDSVFKEGNSITMDTELQFGEDEVWLYEVLANSTSVSFVPKPLYNWRSRNGSITREKEITAEHMSLLKAKNRILNMTGSFETKESYIKAGVFNDCYMLKLLSYCSSGQEYYKLSAFF